MIPELDDGVIGGVGTIRRAIDWRIAMGLGGKCKEAGDGGSQRLHDLPLDLLFWTRPLPLAARRRTFNKLKKR